MIKNLYKNFLKKIKWIISNDILFLILMILFVFLSIIICCSLFPYKSEDNEIDRQSIEKCIMYLQKIELQSLGYKDKEL